MIRGWRLTGVFTFVSGSLLRFRPIPALCFIMGTTHRSVPASRKKRGLILPTLLHSPPGIRRLPSLRLIQHGRKFRACLATDGFQPPPRNGVYNDYYIRSNNFSETFGDIRNPYEVNIDLGVHKIFPIYKGTHL